MSINDAMQSGVSGLVANSAALSTIANNIANVNTVGYKQSESEFESLVTSEGGSNDSSSGGVAATTVNLIDQQGSSIQTSSPLDLAIQGQGFFVTTNQGTNVGATSPALFTRAGSFQVNSQGYLVNSAGLVLQGWPANANGTITPNPSSLTSLQGINVSQVGGAVSPTTAIGINANLDASQTVSAAATAAATASPGAYNPSTNSMAMYDSNPATGVAPDYTIQVPISDSQGGSHTVQIDLLKSTVPDQWYAEIVAVPPTDVVDGDHDEVHDDEHDAEPQPPSGPPTAAGGDEDAVEDAATDSPHDEAAPTTPPPDADDDPESTGSEGPPTV